MASGGVDGGSGEAGVDNGGGLVKRSGDVGVFGSGLWLVRGYGSGGWSYDWRNNP